MKNLRTSAYAALLLAMVSTGLQAQQASGWGISGSLLTGAGRTNDAAGVKSGFTLSGSYTFETSLGYAVRPGIALNMLIGSGVTGVDAMAEDEIASGEPYQVAGSSLKHTFTGMQVYGDIVIPIFDKKADWFVGLSANKYSVKVSGAPAGAYSPLELDAATRTVSPDSGNLIASGNANGTTSVPGWKLGLRAGVDYHVTPALSIRAMLQMTEMGRISSDPGQIPTLNPAWLELGVFYRF